VLEQNSKAFKKSRVIKKNKDGRYSQGFERFLTISGNGFNVLIIPKKIKITQKHTI